MRDVIPRATVGPLASAIAGVVLLLTTAAALAEDPVTRVVALDGDAAQEAQPNETLLPTGSREFLSIDDAGRVLFDAFTTTGFGGREGFFLATGRSAAPLAFIGDSVPDAGLPNYTYRGFDLVQLGPQGNVLIEATISDGTFFEPAFITRVGGTWRVSGTEFISTIPGLPCPLERLGSGLFAGDVNLNGEYLIFPGESCELDTESVFLRNVTSDAFPIVVEMTTVPIPGERQFDSLFSSVNVHTTGTASFRGRYLVGADLINALFLKPLGASTQLVAATGTKFSGNSRKITALGGLIFGAVPDQATEPTRAYVALAKTDPPINGERAKHYVFHSSNTTGPVFATGTTDNGFTFTATVNGLTARAGMALAEGNQVVIVGDTTGPDVKGGEALAVWLYDPPGILDPFDVVLFEGQAALDDPTARTIDRILTVSVGRSGRIACEVELSDGSQAIVVQNASGGVQMPIVAGTDFTAGDESFRCVGILQSLPSFPTVHGPGFDGRQSRFNQNGEFVFRARVTPASTGRTVDGIFVVSVDEVTVPETCDVTVKRAGKNLSVSGGDRGCNVEIDVGEEGEVTVSAGDANTTINGASTPFQGTLGGGLNMRFVKGGSTITVSGADESDEPDTNNVPGNIAFSGGPGADQLTFEGIDVSGSVTLSMGKGGTEDAADFRRTFISKHLKHSGRSGESDLEFESGAVGGNVSIDAGAGGSFVRFIESPTSGSFTVRFAAGAGTRQLVMDDSRVAKNLKIASAGGVGMFTLENGTNVGGKCSISTGPGGSTLLIQTASIGGTAVIKGGSGTDSLSLDDVECAGSFKLDGRGGANDTLSLKGFRTDGKCAISTKKSPFSTCIADGLSIDAALTMAFGTAGSSVSLFNVSSDKCTISTNGTLPAGQRHVIAIEGSGPERSMSIRGKGSHEIKFDGVGFGSGLALNLRNGVNDEVELKECTVIKGLMQISTKASTMFICSVIDSMVLDKGALSVRSSGQAVDLVSVTGTTVGGRAQISTGAGDDGVIVDGTTVGGDLLLSGGPGFDVLFEAGITPNTVTGQIKKDSFEQE